MSELAKWFMTTEQWLIAMSVSVCLFRASSLWFLSPGTLASFHKVKDSDGYAGMTLRVHHTVRKLTFKPTFLGGGF